MFFRIIYNNLFNISAYKANKKKSLVYSIIYIVILTILCGILSLWMGYYKYKPYLDAQINKVYDKVPGFTLSSQGLEIDGDGVYRFEFAGVDFYINDTKTFLEMIIDDGLDDNRKRTYVGKNGFGVVEGTMLKNAEYFKDTVVLKNLVLKKDDFTVIYETIQLMYKNILLLLFMIIIIITLLYIFIKNIFYTIVVKSILKIKHKEIKFKEAYKLSLFCQTFYIMYFGIVIYSNMHLIVPIKILMLEIISLVYIFLLGLNYNRDNRGEEREGYKKKKRC